MSVSVLPPGTRRHNRRLGLLSVRYRLKEGWRFERLSHRLWLVSRGDSAVIAELTESAAMFIEASTSEA